MLTTYVGCSYQGDMTIRFQTGLSIRIPNNQIVAPHTGVNMTTGFIDVNPASPDLTIDSLQDVEATKMAHLGWGFLSSAYVHVNQDAGQFYLWAANPTADQDLVAVDATGNDVTSFCAANSPATTSAPPTSASPTSTATIAGAVAGSVVGVAAVGGLACWLFKRRRSAAAAKNGGPPLVQHDNTPPGYVVSGSMWKSGLQEQECRKSELDATSGMSRTNVQHELPG